MNLNIEHLLRAPTRRGVKSICSVCNFESLKLAGGENYTIINDTDDNFFFMVLLYSKNKYI